MREIKFRAWYTKYPRKGMHYFVELVSYPDESTEVNLIGNNYQDSFVPDDSCLELMQYTGLRDCKGAEIYEGDIVKVDTGLEELHVSRVDFKHGCFVFQSIMSPKFSTMALFVGFGDAMEYCEVIGNIYEHPELLR